MKIENQSTQYEGIEITANDSIEMIERKLATARIEAIEADLTDLYLMANEATKFGSTDITSKLRVANIAKLEAELLNLLTVAS